MKSITDAAFVVSVHYDDPNGHARINLNWIGNHEISDFNLDSLGTVVDCETETENTGWAIVRSSQLLNDSIVAPLSQFGHRILPSSISPGDVIPLRLETKKLSDSVALLNGNHEALTAPKKARRALLNPYIRREHGRGIFGR